MGPCSPRSEPRARVLSPVALSEGCNNNNTSRRLDVAAQNECNRVPQRVTGAADALRRPLASTGASDAAHASAAAPRAQPSLGEAGCWRYRGQHCSDACARLARPCAHDAAFGRLARSLDWYLGVGWWGVCLWVGVARVGVLARRWCHCPPNPPISSSRAPLPASAGGALRTSRTSRSSLA